MPALHVDGVVVTQSDAITRYAGKLAGLYPIDAYQALLCDLVAQVAPLVSAQAQSLAQSPAIAQYYAQFAPKQFKKTYPAPLWAVLWISVFTSRQTRARLGLAHGAFKTGNFRAGGIGAW